MKSFFSRKSLRVYVAIIFIVSVGITVFLQQHNPSKEVPHPESVVLSDTIIGDASHHKSDSLQELKK